MSAKPRSEVRQEEVQAAKQVVLGADLPEVAERRLEVIVPHGKVIVVCQGRILGLHERGGPPLRVDAPVVHVIAGERAARPELDQRGGLDVIGRDQDAAVIAVHHAPADLARQVGIAGDIRRILHVPAPELLVGDVVVEAEARKAERVPEIARHRGELAAPESLGIGSVERDDLAERHRRGHLGPARARVQRHVQARIRRRSSSGPAGSRPAPSIHCQAGCL